MSFDNMRLLDQHYLRDYQGTMGSEIDAASHGDAATLELLKGLCAEPIVTFDKEKTTWTITFSVLCHDDGRVERWAFTGTMNKFVIKSWNRENLIGRGKIRPMVEQGSKN